MKILIGLLVLSSLAYSQAKPVEISVTNVTFDTEKCILAWTSERDGGPARTFTIDLHKGLMTDGRKSFPLSPEEQAIMHQELHDVIVVYAAASVVWFDRGGKYTKPEAEESEPLKSAKPTRRAAPAGGGK